MEGIRHETTNGISHVTLDRPRVRNALDIGMLHALEGALGDASADGSTRLVLLTANGPAFCAGMDLKSVDLTDPDAAVRFAASLSRIYLRLMTLPVPLLCAVDGPVSGGGVGLVAAADLVWAGPDARFALPETRLGLVPALVSAPLVPRVGVGAVRSMALGRPPLDAEGAVALGLADFAAPDRGSVAALAFAQDLLRDHAPGALARTKRFLAKLEGDELEGRLASAVDEFVAAVATDEARRGLDAFRRKESVRWDTA